jgi:hypothetical protein
MIDSSRLERNLIAVARRYAPGLAAGWQQPGDYSGALGDLAQALAGYNVLVMLGDPGAATVKAWTDSYLGFYALLTETLFPSFARVSAFYVDQTPPLIVAVYGEATPVITSLAGFVVPYVVARQGTRPAEVELYGMMDMILEELEATDVSRDEYRQLREGGAAYLRGLLEGEVRQLPLTPPIRPIFDDLSSRPAAVSTSKHERTAPPPPADLPEPPLPNTMPEEALPPPDLPEAPVEPARRSFDPDAVPIFFNPSKGSVGDLTRPAPPVPPLPPRTSPQ